MLFLFCACFYSCKPNVSEWHKVTIVSRTVSDSLNLGTSNSQIVLVFSDGTSWASHPSHTNFGEKFLLKAQKGETVYYRYNSHYLSGKQWKN